MDKTQNDMIVIKNSHIQLYNDFPTYYMAAGGKPILFKKAGEKIDTKVLYKDKFSKFYIKREDKSLAVEKVISSLNRKLLNDISSKGIAVIRQSICNVVEESLQGPLETSLNQLPETIEIIFGKVKKFPELLNALTSIQSTSSRIVEHSVNVLALTTQYCLFKKFSDDEVRKFGLCALLHDLGSIYLDNKLINTKDRLSDEDFKTMKTHTIKGYEDLKSNRSFDSTVAQTALEHHELLDGTGYPYGISNMSFESQVIGLIDSYEPLKYNEKSFRKALNPYYALQIIKEDVLQGKYDRNVFKDLCSCLTK